MTKKELKKLSRVELLELLLIQTKQIEELQSKNSELEELLKERRVVASKVGSIAEAAMELNDVFGTAQRAADQYLKHVKEMWLQTQKFCEQKQQEAEQMLKNTKEDCSKLNEKKEFQCISMQDKDSLQLYLEKNKPAKRNL